MKVGVPLIHQLRDQLWVLHESQLLRSVGVKSLLFFVELCVTAFHSSRIFQDHFALP